MRLFVLWVLEMTCVEVVALYGTHEFVLSEHCTCETEFSKLKLTRQLLIAHRLDCYSKTLRITGNVLIRCKCSI